MKSLHCTWEPLLPREIKYFCGCKNCDLENVYNTWKKGNVQNVHHKLERKGQSTMASVCPIRANFQDLRKLGNFKKVPEILRFNDNYPTGHLKVKFEHFLVKSWKKLALKHSIEKTILLNFVNLSTTFCPRLSEETDFHFWLIPGPLILDFLMILKNFRPIRL